MRADILQYSVSLLARREHSSLELQRKLLAKGFPEPLIEATLQRLAADKLLSDERFAEAYVQSRMNRGFGPLRIEAELRERGTPADLIKAWVTPNAQHWREQARVTWRKRFGREPKDYQERARQMRFLQQRGYTTDQINAVFKTLKNYDDQ